jgi:hypothetical protein
MSDAPRRLRILITNNTLAGRAGSELYVRDLALGLLHRGHVPVAYSSVLGEVACELTAASIPVLNDLRALAVTPDVIHAHHHLDAMTAMLRYPDVPAVYVCHGWQPWEEQPPVFPSIRRYVGVDDVCTERLLTTPGVDAARVRTVYNAVDLTRFGRRADPLPGRPRSALVFSNYATEDNYPGTVREACRAAAIDRVDVIGRGTGTAVDRPELVLPRYDLVFAKARCALEAMAVGAAVIVADASGLGGMVTPANVEEMRRLNFGLRVMQRGPLTAEAIGVEIARYHPESSEAVCGFIRSHADANATIDRFERMYREALEEPVAWSAAAGREACGSASSYLLSLVDRLKGEAAERRRHADAEARIAARLQAAEARLSALQSDLTRQERDLTARTRVLAHAEATLDRTQAALVQTQQSLTAVKRELEAVRGSRSWRLLGAYRGVRTWLREV